MSAELDEAGLVAYAELPESVAECGRKAILRLTAPNRAGVTTTTERTRKCEECDRRVTVGTDGTTEFGHVRGVSHGGERCPNRPDRADPERECGWAVVKAEE